MCERALNSGTLAVYSGIRCNRTLAVCERAPYSRTLAGSCRTEYCRTRNASGVVVADRASSGGSSAVQCAFDANILVLAAQVGEGLKESVAEEREQVIAYAGIRGHDVREFILKRGQKWLLDVDHIVAVGDRATIVGI